MIGSRAQSLLLPLLTAAGLSVAGTAQTLIADTQSIPANGTRSQSLSLLANNVTPGSVYLVVGSVTGTSPGIPLGPGLLLPLNPDFYLDFTSSFQNSSLLPSGFGSIQSGVAQTDFVIPPLATLAGLRFDHAFVVIDNLQFTGVSNSVPTWISTNPLNIDGLNEGDEVLGPVIDLEGDVGDLVAGTPGALVTVNGQLATLDPTGARWSLNGLNLGIGPRVLTVRSQNTAGDYEQFAIRVDFTELEVNNIVADDRGRAFASLGQAGFARIDLTSRRVDLFPPPVGTSQVDDLSVANGSLFLVDGVLPGRLTVVSTDDPAIVFSPPVPIAIGPYTGVSADGGFVAVAGGASQLTVFEVDSRGNLSTQFSTIDLGEGHPDVTLVDGGTRAIASVDFASPVNGEGFGISALDLQAVPTAPLVQWSRGVPGAGVTSGVRAPANFPLVSAETSGPWFVVAHGGGLSFFDDQTGAPGPVLPVGSMNYVTSVGSTVFAVGGTRLVEVDTSGMVPVVVSNQFLPGTGRDFTSVAADADHIAIGANEGGLLIFRR